MLVMAPQIRAAFPVSFRGGKKTTHITEVTQMHTCCGLLGDRQCVLMCV